MRGVALGGFAVLAVLAVAASAATPIKPPSGQIAYARNIVIYLIPSTGGTPKKLVAGEYPSYIGDGKILFERNGDFYTVKVDGTGETRLTKNLNGQQPALSPDGKTIVYSGRAKSNPDVGRTIWFIGVDGKGARERTSFDAIAPGGDMWPAWSPDGKSVVFTHVAVSDPPDEITSTRLDLVSVAGKTKPRTVDGNTSEAAPEDCCPEPRSIWAANGWIYYADRGKIAKIRPNKSGRVALTPGPGDTAPTFAPGKRWFAFIRESGNRDGLYVFDTVTKKQIRLAKGGFPAPEDPTWIPAS